MTSQEIAALYDLHALPVYAPEIALVRGRGCKVWDAEGKEYLDLTAGISVCNLGHCPPTVTEAISQQADTLVHVSNLFYNSRQAELAQKLSRASNGYKFFFANSGAEANEGLIKFARKWGNEVPGRNRVIAMNHSFHGRTLGTLAATDKPAIRAGFEPEVDGFDFVPFNDLDALEQAICASTAAVLMEPVQAEGGVYPASPGYLQRVRDLCDAKGILLLFDEVQTGIGRCGRLFAHQHYEVEPDAFSLAKALGNGYPIGAIGVHPRHNAVLGVGSHATTFGGTPLACAAACAVLDQLEQGDVLAHCRAMGELLAAELRSLVAPLPGFGEVRQLGLLIGIQASGPVAPIVKAAADRGLLILSAGANVLRLLPPLTITSEEIQQGLQILRSCLNEVHA